MNSPAANSSGSAGSPPPPSFNEFFLVLPDGSCIPATAATLKSILKQARDEARKRARAKRAEKAAEIQMALEDRAITRRLLAELAEMERGSIRWAARMKIRTEPEPSARRTSNVVKRVISASLSARPLQLPQPASSWTRDDLGMRGVIWQQSYLGRKTPGFHRGAAAEKWYYDVRDEAVHRDAGGEPVIVSNMGEDWLEIGAAWQAIEDASTRANAKIQIRVVAPFDADATGGEKIAALTLFCRTVLKPLGLPYSAVIHDAPDGGDSRNVHAHLLFSLRPVRRIEPYTWEVADEVRSELDGRNGVQMLRHLWAHALSQAAEDSRSNRRYTGLSYGARGLAFEAGEHLGEARNAMVRRGERVWANERNRIRIARNAAVRAIRDADHKIEALKKVRDAIVARHAQEGRVETTRRVVTTSPQVAPAPLVRTPGSRPRSSQTYTSSRAVEPFAPKVRTSGSSSTNVAVLDERKTARVRRPSFSPSNATSPQAPVAREAGGLATPPPQLAGSRVQTKAVQTPARRSVAAAPPPLMPRCPSRDQQVPLHTVPLPSSIETFALRAPTKGREPSRRLTSRSRRLPSSELAAPALPHWLVHLDLAARRAAKEKAAKAAQARTRVTVPDWIPPFEADGTPSAALRDLLLAIARRPGTVHLASDGTIDAAQAIEPVRVLLDIWRSDNIAPLASEVIARAGRAGRERWPVVIADAMETHDRLRSGQAAPARVSDARNTGRPPLYPRRQRIAEPNDRYRSRLPTIDDAPTRAWLEAHPRMVAPDARRPLSDLDRQRIAHLRRIDAYVADAGDELLGIDRQTLMAIGGDPAWLMRPEIQDTLTTIRDDQQMVVAALRLAAEAHPQAFATSPARFRPQALGTERLRRVDRWLADPNYLRELLASDLRLGDADPRRSTGKVVGFLSASALDVTAPGRTSNGSREQVDKPAPVYLDQGGHARPAAFDATGAPTDSLLRLLVLVSERPSTISIATDGRLMVAGKAPAMLAPLLHGWRHDETVTDLVAETMRLSRGAGRPAWPTRIAGAVHAFRIRDRGPGTSAARRDLTNQIDRS